MAKRKSERSYHHGDLQNALLQAGRQLLVKGGPEALTLREVAKRAGVSHAAPYRHYPSKDHLLAALAAEGFQALAASLRAAEAEAGPDAGPEARLISQGLGYVRFAKAHPAEVRIMFRPNPVAGECAPLAEAGGAAFGLLLSAVEACQRAGVFAPGDSMARAVACWSMVHGFSMLLLDEAFSLPGGGVPPGQTEAAARAAIEMLVKGMRA